ncbi:S-adenosyl-L-methionine-dependent methyltransferase [Zychaea mexicana]|uniref:S-adenosyl-L-methionine-dependent methyltransferase n=1 Tax=Zychaea mexicana TaxID=64656 RepID=UPI0022FEFC2B|nr:S-adenosyl-L-methionine-dependent methyltransferase [Zychaea mexicana]KAI9492468.1 S-adenosyl-L-methionine-dependent methyltransferase [Zychaea mexicana]
MYIDTLEPVTNRSSEQQHYSLAILKHNGDIYRLNCIFKDYQKHKLDLVCSLATADFISLLYIKRFCHATSVFRVTEFQRAKFFMCELEKPTFGTHCFIYFDMAESGGDRRAERLARKIEASKNKKPAKSKNKEKAAAREQERREAVFNAFSNFYQEEYGHERWQTLIEALKKPVRHCIMVNKYSNTDDFKERLSTLPELIPLSFVRIPCFATTADRFPHPRKDRAGITDYYILDAGSVLATEALDIQPDDRVLDLCAAPGGKSVSVLQRLGAYGSLTVNELSPDRRRRLRIVLDDYLSPKDERITVLGKDGTKWYSEPEQYDKVLLDAPCSSERHLLHDDKEFEQWSPKRTVHNAERQLKLLKAAVHSVCVGGLVVYGTCSISSTENDKVVSKMIRKGKVPVEVVKKTFPIGERTKYGWIILPDKTDGWGPLYFSVLRRTGVSKQEEQQDNDNEGDHNNEA